MGTIWYKDVAWSEKRKHKYNAQPVWIDGKHFASKKEGDYYLQLKMLKERKAVKDFQCQVHFNLLPDFAYKGENVRGIDYVADFVVTWADGHTEVIDVKGYKTDVYELKKKLLMAKYPDIDFKEVY